MFEIWIYTIDRVKHRSFSRWNLWIYLLQMEAKPVKNASSLLQFSGHSELKTGLPKKKFLLPDPSLWRKIGQGVFMLCLSQSLTFGYSFAKPHLWCWQNISEYNIGHFTGRTKVHKNMEKKNSREFSEDRTLILSSRFWTSFFCSTFVCKVCPLTEDIKVVRCYTQLSSFITFVF